MASKMESRNEGRIGGTMTNSNHKGEKRRSMKMTTTTMRMMLVVVVMMIVAVTYGDLVTRSEEPNFQIVNFNKPNAGVSTSSASHSTPGDHFQTRHRHDQPRDTSLHPSSVLIIPHVQVNQSGDYTCIVENSAGRAEATFKLVVTPDFGANSSQSVAYQLDEADIWRRESILGVTASIIIIPVLVFTILLWQLKKRKREAGKRKNPFNKSLAVPLTEKNNEACGTDDDDSNDGWCLN